MRIERRSFHPNAYPMDPARGVPRDGIQIFHDRNLSDYGVGGRIEGGRLGPVPGYLCTRAIAADVRLAGVVVPCDPGHVIVVDDGRIPDLEVLAILGLRPVGPAPALTVADLEAASREELLDAAKIADLKVDGRWSDAKIRDSIASKLGISA
jgi:hypothetical protein